MHRIDTTSAVATMPSPNPQGNAGFFAHGSPVSGVPYTVLSSDWANAVQEEIGNVIRSASIALDKGRQDQLLMAINAKINAGLATIPPPLGFTPVQQGGGANQLSNKVRIGWDGAGTRIQIDNSDMGDVAMQQQANTFTQPNTFNSNVAVGGQITANGQIYAAGPIGSNVAVNSNGAMNAAGGFWYGSQRCLVTSDFGLVGSTSPTNSPQWSVSLPNGAIFKGGQVQGYVFYGYTGKSWRVEVPFTSAYPNTMVLTLATIVDASDNYGPVAIFNGSNGGFSISQTNLGGQTGAYNMMWFALGN